MFVGLFVVVAGSRRRCLRGGDREAGRLRLDDTIVLAGVTALLSNVVSNVPAVFLLKSFVPGLYDPQRAWLVIAMAATLAGNFTLVGSVANLIVAQRAKTRGVEIGFWSYFKVGATLTLMAVVIGMWLAAPVRRRVAMRGSRRAGRGRLDRSRNPSDFSCRVHAGERSHAAISTSPARTMPPSGWRRAPIEGP